jgi:hypothetical protein
MSLIAVKITEDFHSAVVFPGQAPFFDRQK